MPNPFSTPDDTIIRTKLPVFAPRRIISVAAYIEWVPDEPDKAFFSSDYSAFTIGADSSSGSTYIDISPGQVIGINPGTTFTFNTAVDLAVM